MSYSPKMKMGKILANKNAKAVLLKYVPQLLEPTEFPIMFVKLNTLEQLISRLPESLRQKDIEEKLYSELAAIEELEEETGYFAPASNYESESAILGSAKVSIPKEVEKWSVFEVELHGPAHGNPFTDVTLEAEFICNGEKRYKTLGFYDGEGIYRIRFMPGIEGSWTFKTTSNARSLTGIEGEFTCVSPSKENHGPVRVKNTFHFSYEDGTPYVPVGTTCYAWVHQEEKLIQQTLNTLQASPFNKIRMCVFPKSYQFNSNEPLFYPFEGSLEEGWDFTRFNPKFFQHLEQRIADLGNLGIEADLILYHAYDRWGFAEMKKAEDDRYLRYLSARLSAYRNLWWSLANEYDLMWAKEIEDWERFAQIITENDPHHHLISIHNCWGFYDYSRPWITHCSVQRIDVYKTSENTDDWRKQWNKPIVIDECAYEGDIDQGWGNITGEEMVRRFWEGAVRGGYVGHGETYLHPEDILWWSKGGQLHGDSPKRIGFLRRIMEEGPQEGLNPLETAWDAPSAGIPDKFYLYYYGFNRPSFREYRMKPGIQYKVDVIDTWDMTINELEDVYEGKFRIELPGKQYMAVRMTKI
ncbi:DUF5060 domain-containing protein [Bacillus sp. AFS076308]|uniref:DUF5605 domain-containing protein n=1 Tax=Bacillus sp. AFS076308 TaxID=2033512 RepID=UPI000BF66D1B|nr:DUF5605 domain-containing protein [Bacillus sp. AFS076308]PFO06342.1 DUF5060 domain-containing protein [Bacillus sp. AFS076308]